jgi:tetratricopeptide (TPR) repeat protein
MKQRPPIRDPGADASPLLQAAIRMHRLGELDRAERLYKAVLAAQPRHFEAWHRLGLLQFQQRRNEEASRSLSAALRAAPAHAAVWSDLGVVQATMGRFEQAVACYDEAIALEPDHAGALSNKGIALVALERPRDALASYDRALAVNPEFVEALANRGGLLRELGRPAEALASLDRALAIRPDYADALNNRGNALVELGRAQEALACYDKALAANPHSANTLNNRGNALIKLGRAKEALTSYQQALALKPDFVQALANRAAALLELKRPAEALASCGKALALEPDFAEAHNNHGSALANLGREEEALASYDKAIALKPNYAAAYDNKGFALLQLGRLAEASASARAAITLAPRRARSYHHFAQTKRFELGDPLFAAMEELARENSPLDANERIFAHFALGKAYADVADYPRSFRHFSQGGALKRKQVDYDEAAVLGDLRRAETTCTRKFMRRRYGCGDPSPAPVFVVGMPRSGTTLIEQILASHRDVHGAGEIEDFERAAAELGGVAALALRRPEIVAEMSDEQFRRLGANYVRRIGADASSASRIVNKTTDNFRFAGLIALALPNARIVHVRRDPVDACFSCFSTLFGDNLPYAYDLAELGRYYRAYEALMGHWRDALPKGMMIDVRYEDVIDDLEGQARRIVSHCGLDWDAHCLAFHRHARSVRTASLVQVRRPLYRSSVGRWRPYAAFLTPLLAALGPSLAPADRVRTPMGPSTPSLWAA